MPAPGFQTPSMAAFAQKLEAWLPLGPALTGFPDDAAGFTSRYGPAIRSPPTRDFVTPLRRTGSVPIAGSPARGPWRLPGPDSHRLAALS